MVAIGMRIALLIATCSFVAFAQDPRPRVKAAYVDAGAPAPNAVQLEMQALHALVVTALVAIESGKTDAIPAAIQQVHQAKG